MIRVTPALLCASLLASCATPQMPSGGPPDTTPPGIVASDPGAGTVDVSGRTIHITFSEYVDESSFARALSIAPAGRPEISWSGRTVTIRLDEEFRPNTTYVVTLDTGLRDIRSVALTAPITLAFSTGPTINAGTLAGRVVLPETGAPAAGVDVFAYALPDSAAPVAITPPPDYRTQTDPSGAFAFDYLTEQYYHVIALRDENRNLTPDPPEAFAVAPVAALFADTLASEPEAPWVMTRVDTTRPAPLRVQSLAASRHILHLSEPVRFVDRDPSRWQLRDSTSGEEVEVAALYAASANPRQVIFATPPLRQAVFTLRPAALADSSGNLIREQAVTFTPSSAEDTLQVRFVGFLPENVEGPEYVLPRSREPGLRFNAPLDRELLGRAVAVADTNGSALPYSAVTMDGTIYRLIFEPPLETVGPVAVRVDGTHLAGPDSVRTAVFRRLPASESGEIRGVVDSPVDRVVVELHPVETPIPVPRYDARADAEGAFRFAHLPAGTYRLRAFGDLDGDGSWDGGTLVPFHPPEPIVWVAEPTRVRARWETSLPDTLRIRAPDSIYSP